MKPSRLEIRYQRCFEAAKAKGQGHIFQWWEELEEKEREYFLEEVEGIDWELMDGLIQSHVLQDTKETIGRKIEEAKVWPQQPGPAEIKEYEEARQQGEELIGAGKVAVVTVAGGQGTRLGFDGPKGTLKITPLREKSLFQVFAENLRAARKRYGRSIPWYLMTSASNHEQTKAFFKEHGHWGLPPGEVTFFKQRMLPAYDFKGKMLMEDKHRLAMAPDGHGGTLGALARNGCLKKMRKAGILFLSYFHVDNCLVKPLDPVFLGLHQRTGSEMSCKAVSKAEDMEKVGNLCVEDGKYRVIEYTFFPEELARAKNAAGKRKFDAGSIGIHIFNLDFIERLTREKTTLPFHRAEKKIAWMDENGFQRSPRAPNGVKLETFIFDALPLAQNPLILEVERGEEFSPVKNAKGVDSLETARRDQIRRAARWIEKAGVAVPRLKDAEPEVTVEIAPSYALSAEDVKERVKSKVALEPGEKVYIY